MSDYDKEIREFGFRPLDQDKNRIRIRPFGKKDPEWTLCQIQIILSEKKGPDFFFSPFLWIRIRTPDLKVKNI